MARTVTTQQLASEIADLKLMFAAFMQAQAAKTEAPAVEIAEPYVPEVKHAPTQTPAKVAPKAKPAPVVSDKPAQVAPADGKKPLPSAAVYRMDGALWVAFPAMDTCTNEADFLFGKLKAYPWFVTHDSKGNASPKKSLQVLPFIYDKRKGDKRPGPLSGYTGGHSCHIGSFDRAPAFKQVAALIDGLLAEYRAEQAKRAAQATEAPARKPQLTVVPDTYAPVFA